MPKRRLFTPGPTELPADARLAMARQLRHHRTPEFRAVLAELCAGLRELLQTQNDVLVLSSSGTGAMEASVVNLLPRGGKAIVLESGKFAERWTHLCERFGATAVRYTVPWGEPFEPAQLAQHLAAHPDAIAVFGTLMETSTGVGHDIEGLGRVVREAGRLFVVDGISGVGAMECRTDAWGIDVLAVGAQKALMGPPGLAYLAVNPRAWRQIEAIDRPAFYFDLLAYRKSAAESDTPYTPAIPLVHAQVAALRELQAIGIERVWGRVRRLSEAVRAGVTALGLRLVASRPADGMTAAYFPEGVDGKALLVRLECRFGVKFSGGQGPLKGKAFRIAHFGQIDEFDVLGALAALELVLVEFKQPIKLGSAVAAAGEVLAATAVDT